MVTSTTSGLARCDAHRAQPAGWRCQDCGAALCPDCTWLHEVGSATLPACVRCRGLAAPITVHRADRRPFAARLPEALAFPVADGGWSVLAGAALIFWAFSRLGLGFGLLAYGLQWSLYFSVVRHTANHGGPLETPDFGDLWEDVALPTIRGVLALSLVWIPAAAWLLARHELPELADGALVTDPVAWLLLLVGVAWAPAALTAAAVADSTLTLLDPRVPFHLAARLGRDYALLVGVALGAALLNVLAGFAARAVDALPLPIVSGVAARALDLWMPLVFMRAAGLLVWARGDDLGFGPPGDYQEPVLPGAVPRAPPPPRPSAVEEARRRVEAIELDPAPGEGARPEPLAAPPARPDPSALFEQARAAAAAGQFQGAADLLREAAADEEHPVAPTAWLVLARLYRNRLGHPDAARQALEYLLARWPEGEPARQARALLDAP